ncbi:hypothetical protein L218DRAFT_947122 [Marasmius fiardii PR-910]|nr:hypothetical protein L218DRAFT_947122 [Marasmius fiardii PR-910]
MLTAYRHNCIGYTSHSEIILLSELCDDSSFSLSIRYNRPLKPAYGIGSRISIHYTEESYQVEEYNSAHSILDSNSRSCVLLVLPPLQGLLEAVVRGPPFQCQLLQIYFHCTLQSQEPYECTHGSEASFVPELWKHLIQLHNKDAMRQNKRLTPALTRNVRINLDTCQEAIIIWSGAQGSVIFIAFPASDVCNGKITWGTIVLRLPPSLPAWSPFGYTVRPFPVTTTAVSVTNTRPPLFCLLPAPVHPSEAAVLPEHESGAFTSYYSPNTNAGTNANKGGPVVGVASDSLSKNGALAHATKPMLILGAISAVVVASL